VGGLTIDKGNVDVAGNTIISGVGAGEISSTSTDAVNGSQLYATNQQVDQNTTNIAKNTTDITNINTTLDKGLNFSADSGTAVNRKLGDTVAITGDKNIVTTTTANGVQIKLSDNIDVKNVNVSQSITVAEGAKVDMGGNVIENVAAGVKDTDAVNVGQLKNVANHISNVEDKLSGGIAASAALAVVTPVEPGTYHLSGGTAYYNGGYGVGFNLLKRSDNGRTTMHAGVAWGSGGGGALVRVGAGFSFGGN
jgi:autotransporter adhesin